MTLNGGFNHYVHDVHNCVAIDHMLLFVKLSVISSFDQCSIDWRYSLDLYFGL